MRAAAITLVAAASVLIPVWLLGVRPPSPGPSTAQAASDSTPAAVHAPAPANASRPAVKRAEVFVAPGSAPSFGTSVHARGPATATTVSAPR